MRRIAVLGCFLLSGVTALAYEVVWVRMLTLVFGATVLSVGTVLASYMAGLALGSWFWSRRADATDRPLRLYAALEAGVALAAALTPLLFGLVRVVYTAAFAEGVSDFSLLSVVRFVLCFPALVLPTFLMGGTLPVLARFYTATPERIGRGAGDLYALNTFGATAGTLLAGFVLLPALGVQGTLYAAVVVNLAVAAVAAVLGRTAPPVGGAWHPGHGPAETPTLDPRAVTAVVVGFGLSGFASMIFEVAWTRAFVQVFGNSTYAFTTMLAAFLVGIALGAGVAGRLTDRARYPVFAFAVLQLVIGTWSAACTPLIEFLPPVFLRAYKATGGDFGSIQLALFGSCCLLLLPTTLALGAAFPVASRVFAARAGGAGRSTGLPYAANTLGTVLGALAAGFVLLPHLGIERSVAVAVVLNLAVWGLLLGVGRERPAAPGALGGLTLLGLITLAKLVVVGLDPQVMTAGVYMYPEFFLAAQEGQGSLSDVFRAKQVLFYREGYGASISIFRLPDGSLTLQTNGKTDASTRDLATQRVLAHLPMLLAPGAKDVLVVGLASGCTTGSTLLYPVEHVDCVEIEPAMVQAARWFEPWNYRCLHDPRLRLVLGDARNHVLMTRRRYDVITAEPTNPWIAGVNNLFTREYYQDCAQRLKPGGLMCQWLPAYNLAEDELRAALASFHSVFPYVTLWAFPGLRTDFFAIGSLAPLPTRPASVLAALRGQVLADSRPSGVDSLWRLYGGLILDAAALERYVAGGTLNTDEHPLLEYSTPRHLYQHRLSQRTMAGVYQAGVGSALPLAPAEAAALCGALGLPPAVRPVSAALVPSHPTELGAVNPEQDVAVLGLKAATPAGPADLRVTAPFAATTPWPLQTLWPPAWPAATGGRTALTRGGVAIEVTADAARLAKVVEALR